MLVTLTALACEEDLPPAVATNLGQVCDASFDRGRDERNYEIKHRVSFEAYPAFPRSIMMNDTAIINAYPLPNRRGQPIRVSFKVGSGKNRLAKPVENYSDADFKLFDFEGNAVAFNQKVRLEGTRGGSKADNSCYTAVEKIIVP
ncbi:MAG: hypothetical protein KDK39_00630 [Leptospiraceae bacterium]|nr:hypothetical protein [Leptospiraceae bacterium]